jgi:hypothetical protein
MRIQKLLCLFLLPAVLPGLAVAADCINGSGNLERPLWDGYTLVIGPASDQHVNECGVSVVGTDGKSIFHTFAVDVTMLRITGRDVNGDGKPDVVLLTHTASSPENVYSIVGTVEPAGLIRQIATTANLSFEERSEGHTEIVTHDTAFRDFEGFSADQVPAPLLFLRLKGKEIFNVSQIYWADYERDINEAKSKISKNDIATLRGESPKQKNEANAGKEADPAEVAHMHELQALVLQIVLDQIYGGHGQEAWKTLAEMWPYNDRDRIRGEILRRRMAGVLRDISRPAPKQAASAQ